MNMRRLVDYSEDEEEYKAEEQSAGKQEEVEPKKASKENNILIKRTIEKLKLLDSKVPSKSKSAERFHPHRDGQFSCLIHIQLPTLQEVFDYRKRVYEFIGSSKSVETINWIPQEELHLSLSRRFYICYHQIEDLSLRIQRALEGQKSYDISLDFDNLVVLENETQNRYFIAAPVIRGRKETEELVSLLEGVLKSYNLPTYYSERLFHVSLAHLPHNLHSTTSVRPPTPSEIIINCKNITFLIGKRSKTYRLL
eukprot:TRINITY_DN1933_c0_g1_i4.p1 TRINITY_DN1933_c0_g1~~TRINITY_DN1933_c0_g1_i4.p1  ORF type:complete len:253 (+),score=27.49 TRINITY_DN1933_c0_g1_i4:224-982(+)